MSHYTYVFSLLRECNIESTKLYISRMSGKNIGYWEDKVRKINIQIGQEGFIKINIRIFY